MKAEEAEEIEKNPEKFKNFKRAGFSEETKAEGMTIRDVLRHGVPQEGEDDYVDSEARPWFKVKCRNYRIGGDQR